MIESSEELNKTEHSNGIDTGTEDIGITESETERVATAERLFEFKEWGLQGEWLRLSLDDGASVEGAYYKVEDGKNEVVIFHPGLPGDTVGRFEEEAVEALMSQGYDVFVARHNGLKKQEENKDFFHNTTRSEMDTGVSGNAMEWFSEPRVSISFFAQQKKSITLLTHSFSGTAAANSFVELGQSDVGKEAASMVKKWIVASGTVWEVEGGEVLDPNRDFDVDSLKNVCKELSDNYEISEEGGNAKFIEKTLKTLHTIDSSIGSSMPENTEVIGIYPESDAIVSPEVGTNFFSKLPRGVLYRDQYSGDEEGHSYKRATVKDLLKVIKIKTSKSKHVFDINK